MSELDHTSDDVPSLSPSDSLGFDAVLGGPARLTEVLLEKRRSLAGQEVASWLFGDLTDRELARLLRCAYEVSFKRDEGRYPNFTMFVPARRDVQAVESASVRFEPPLELDVRLLRRLSSAVPPRPDALFVKAAPDGLVCTGIGRFETAGALLPEDVTGLYLSSSGLILEIGGPGDLTVHEAGDVYTLSAGRIHRQFHGNEALEVLPHFTWLRDQIIQAELGDTTDHVADRVGQVLRDTWMYVLKETVRMAHGGAFAVLPVDALATLDLPTDWQEQLSISYPTAPRDLLQSISSYVRVRWGGVRESRQAALRLLIDHARAVARLSATDGYVLLDVRLRVLGFGVKIGWEAEVPSRCVEVDDALEPTGGYLGLRRTGTRHRAAYRLCASVSGATVFVVSQDGDLRIFFSTEDGEVRVTAALEPVTQLFQGI